MKFRHKLFRSLLDILDETSWKAFIIYVYYESVVGLP